MDENKNRLISRLHRIEGQARGIEAMLRERKNYTLIIQQIEAMRAATSQLISMMVEEKFCNPDRVLTEEDMAYLRRFIKRG